MGLLFSMTITVTSCSETEMPEIDNSNEEAVTRSEVPEFLTISYNGNTYYNVPTTYDENGDFVFHDNVFAPIYH